MAIYALGDLHFSFANEKPMSIFGYGWENHPMNIIESWRKTIQEEDVVLVCGDISWAIHIEDARQDLEIIKSLPGKKIFVKGNHDYWWDGIKRIRQMFQDDQHVFLQYSAVNVGNYCVCGTRGWGPPENDEKIYVREVERMAHALSETVKLNPTQDKEIIVMMHFPPTKGDEWDKNYMDLFSKYPVKHVVFGHLHGDDSLKYLPSESNFPWQHHLVSIDFLKFELKKILEL